MFTLALRRVRGAAVALLLALALNLALPGCVSKPGLEVQTYTLDPPPTNAPGSRTSGAVVSLDRVRVAPPYSQSAFTYRLGGHRVESDPYAYFAAPPGWMLTSAIRGYLRNADYIRDVVDPGGEVPVAAAIEADASELCADLPETGEASAVLVLSFRVYLPTTGATPEREVFRKSYTGKRPLSTRTAAEIAVAWNAELAEVVERFLADLRPLVTRPAS